MIAVDGHHQGSIDVVTSWCQYLLALPSPTSSLERSGCGTNITPHRNLTDM